METTPRKGMSKGCLIGLIIALVIIALLIVLLVVIYMNRDSLVKTGASVTIREVKLALAKNPPDGVDTVQFNALADAFIDKIKLEETAQFEPLALIVQQMTKILDDKQVSREEAMTAAAAMIGQYPDLESFWIPQQPEVTPPTDDTLGGE